MMTFKFWQRVKHLTYLLFIFTHSVQFAYAQNNHLTHQEIVTTLQALKAVQHQKQLLVNTLENQNKALLLKVGQLRATKQTLTDTVTIALKEKADLLTKIEHTNADISTKQALAKNIKVNTLSSIGKIQNNIDTGITFKQAHRQATLLQTFDDLASTDTSTQINATTHFLTFLQNELKLSNTVSFWNAPVHLPDNKQKNAYWVRLGLVNQFFMTEDGLDVHLAGRQNTQSFPKQLKNALPNQIKDAMSIMQHRRPPEISTMTFKTRQVK